MLVPITRLLSYYRETPFTIGDGLSEWKGKGGLVLAKKEGNLIGMARLDPLKNSWALSSFVVNPEHRGSGEGKKLLQACLDFLPNETIHLRVRQENEPALKMYQNVGFKSLEACDGRYLMKR